MNDVNYCLVLRMIFILLYMVNVLTLTKLIKSVSELASNFDFSPCKSVTVFNLY